MSDEVPSGRLSQIFDPLTNLQQPTTHYPQQLTLNRRRSNSSSPSTSGRATPAAAAATSNGSSSSSHAQQQHHQHFHQPANQTQQPQNYQYLTQTHNYFQLRAQNGGGAGAGAGGHNYLHTFPSTTTQSHLLQQQQQLWHQQYQYHQQSKNVTPSSYLQQTQQQQHSLPPLYNTSQSLNSSPLLAKRAISFSGQIPLNRQQMDNVNNSLAAMRQQHGIGTAQSTPNSPRLVARNPKKPPPIPAKPINIPATQATNLSHHLEGTQVQPSSSLDGADAPWPHFSSLTDYLDVHQVNNYGQPVPEINWQERCLELQLELHRSKNQAGRIRDMLGEKVSEEVYFWNNFLNKENKTKLFKKNPFDE